MLGKLCRAAWQTVHELIATAAGDDVRPGLVAAIHTAASDLRSHPHIHAIASRVGWDRAGAWHPEPYVDTYACGREARPPEGDLLAHRRRPTQRRAHRAIGLLKSGHTGFSAHNSVTVGAEDPESLEHLARRSPQPRYARGGFAAVPSAPAGPDLLRPPLALERLRLEPERVLYRHKVATHGRGEPFDPDELLARLIMHFPAPRLHVVHYYGYYAHVCRARRWQAGAEGAPTIDANASADDGQTSAERKRLRRGHRTA